MIDKLRKLCEDKEAFDKIVAKGMTIGEWSELNKMSEADFVTYMMSSAAALGRSKMQHDGSNAPVDWVTSDRDETIVVRIMKFGENDEITS